MALAWLGRVGRRSASGSVASRLVSTWLCLLCDDSLPTTLNGGRGQIATFITFVSGKMNLHADDLPSVVTHKSLYSSLHLMAFEFYCFDALFFDFSIIQIENSVIVTIFYYC